MLSGWVRPSRVKLTTRQVSKLSSVLYTAVEIYTDAAAVRTNNVKQNWYEPRVKTSFMGNKSKANNCEKQEIYVRMQSRFYNSSKVKQVLHIRYRSATAECKQGSQTKCELCNISKALNGVGDCDSLQNPEALLTGCDMMIMM